jgi:FeS assembly SUF system protein
MSRDEEDVAMVEPEEKPEKPDESPRAAPPTLDIESAMALEEGVVAALKTVFDPEIPVDIYELGLIYDIDVAAGGRVKVRMTLTSPACPVAGSLPGEVEQKVQGVAGVEAAEVELVWDPPWNPGMMSEAARLELGMF